MQLSAARARATIAAVVLVSHLANFLTPVLAFAQGNSTNVQKGQEYYEQSRFDEAISLLKDLVDRGALAGDDLLRARELLARSYVKKGYPVQGKEMFKAILRTNPSWRPDPIRVPPDETAVFDQALKEFTTEGSAAPPVPGGTPADTSKAVPPVTPPPSAAKPAPTPASTVVPGAAETKEKKKSSKTLWYVIGGAVLIGGIAAAAGGGGGGSSPPPAQALSAFPPSP